MNNRIEQIAALANTAAYSQENPDKYIDGAPHITHESLRNLYAELVFEAGIR